jgi:5-methylcytosine-specific restriction protein A
MWQRVWEKNLKDDFISIGWADLGNVSDLEVNEIYRLHRKTYRKSKPHGAIVDARMVYKFWHDLKIGDRVVARRGRKSIAATGTIVSAPYYSPTKTKKTFSPNKPYPNHIDIKWETANRDVEFDRQVFGMLTIHTISDENLNSLLSSTQPSASHPDEVQKSDFTEGGVKQVLVNAYERDPKAKAACLQHFGYRCQACNMHFAEAYGEIGTNFIHVHHLRPLSTRKKSYKVDPKKDLIPVCPNCHAMLHRGKKLLTIQQLRKIIGIMSSSHSES